jgi:hypothetical protein
MSIIHKGDAPDLLELLPVLTTQTRLYSLWSSPAQAADYIETIPYFWTDAASDNNPNYGTPSRQAALKLARDGWPEGAERAARIRDKITAANPVGPRLVKYDVAGAYPIVARHLAGNPLSMKRYDTARLRRKPVITLVSHMSTRWRTPAANFIRRAGVVAAIIDVVESAGFACHVLASGGAEIDDKSWRVGFTLKESHQPVDIDRIAFGVGHPSMYRRIGFCLAYSEMSMEPLGTGLGRSDENATYPGLAEQQVYVLPFFADDFSSDEKGETIGLKRLLQHLAKQCCPAFPQQQAA